MVEQFPDSFERKLNDEAESLGIELRKHWKDIIKDNSLDDFELGIRILTGGSILAIKDKKQREEYIEHLKNSPYESIDEDYIQKCIDTCQILIDHYKGRPSALTRAHLVVEGAAMMGELTLEEQLEYYEMGYGSGE